MTRSPKAPRPAQKPNVMHEADEKPVALLNSLIGVNNNRIECLRFAGRLTDASVLRLLFSRLADTSIQCREELIREVYKLGGVPHDGTLLTGEFLSIWLEVEAAVSRRDHLAILNSFCLSEGVVISAYENALVTGEEHLNTLQRRLFHGQFLAIRDDAQKLRNLRDTVVNSAAPEPVRQPKKEVIHPRVPARREFPQMIPALIGRPVFQ
jgi:uncharacterized protein (TIGR02284 family)